MSTLTINPFPELSIEVLGSSGASYLLNKIYPTPHLRYFLVITAVDVFVRKGIMFFSNEIANHLTYKNGYVDKDNQVTNPKFFHLMSSGALILINLSPLFYRFVAQKLGLQTPNYIITLTYLVLTARFNSVLINAIKFLGCSLPQLKEESG